MYWCFYKRDLKFKWGDLYKEVKPHYEKKFRTREEAQVYLDKMPEHLRKHLQVTEGIDI